jgi:primosomal protein N'
VYLYSFDRFFGFDKVCILAENASKKKVKAGDLLVFGNQYFLALGETLSFSEQYQHLTTTQAELVYKEFLSAPALKLFHWMVETYYTTYKSVVRLFFADDMEKLLEREAKLKKAVKAALPSKTTMQYNFTLSPE